MCLRRAASARSRAAATSARSTRPPDGEALRDDEQLRLRRGLGVHRRRPAARPPHGAAGVRVRPPRAAELQVNEPDPARLAAEGPRRRRAASSPTRRTDVSPDMSFLEMLDVVNERLIAEGEEPIAFDHDCREGICGTCGLMINGVAARPAPRHHRLPAPHAQLQGRRHDRHRAVARAAPSRCSRTWSSTAARSTGSSRPAASSRCRTGSAPDGNAIPVPKDDADAGDGRRRLHRLRRLRGGLPERLGDAVHRGQGRRTSACCRRASPSAARACAAMVAQMDAEGFGSCTNHGECEAACPKEISVDFIARMNRDYLRASLHGPRPAGGQGQRGRLAARWATVWHEPHRAAPAGAAGPARPGRAPRAARSAWSASSRASRPACARTS